VLVADDDAQLLRLIARLLRVAGMEVEAVASARAALERLSNAKFDLVLSDLFAPEMSGTTLAAAARRLDPALPIVIVSGHPDGQGAIEDRSLQFVCKPFSNDALLDLVRELIELRAERSAPLSRRSVR